MTEVSNEAIGAESLREVRLYGELGKKFGRVHHVAVKTAREAAQALAAIIPGFRQHLIEKSSPGYHVFVGGNKLHNNIGADLLDAPVGRGEPISIVPKVVGSKGNGFLQVVLGVVLIVVGVMTANPYLIQAGLTLTLGGIVQMLTPVTRQTKRDDLEQVSNYHFDGPTNQTREGSPIQIVFGRMIIGSSVVAQGIYSSDLA